MPWDPTVYNQFKNIRYQPFFDLMGLVAETNLSTAIDIGCGTGEQTSILSQRFEGTTFLGIDASPEMLLSSHQLAHERLSFQQANVETFFDQTNQSKWDLIFSNAALQWTDHHCTLFPKLMSHLSEKGQFAVQMPVQNENVLNKILLELVQEKPFSDYLNGWKRLSPVLSIDEYAQMMFENGLKGIQIAIKVYPIIAKDSDTLFDFISGSSLIPYIERLNEDQQKLFIAEYKKRVSITFKSFPTIYAFKRLLLYGKK